MPGHECKKARCALPTATWEAMSELINTRKDGNSLLRPRARLQPSQLLFSERYCRVPLGEMIEKNAAHPSLKRGIRADFRRIVANWSSRRIPIGCPLPGFSPSRYYSRDKIGSTSRVCIFYAPFFFFTDKLGWNSIEPILPPCRGWEERQRSRWKRWYCPREVD